MYLGKLIGENLKDDKMVYIVEAPLIRHSMWKLYRTASWVCII